MRKNLIAALGAVVLVCELGVANAQEPVATGGGGGSSSDSGIGVGVEAMLAGPAGPTFVYQAAQFHVSVLFSFDTGVDEAFLSGDDEISVGGRFFYEIHSGEISDFSLGGGFGIDDDDGGGGGDDDDIDIHLEGAAQIRAFIVPNVALHSTLGLAIEFDDDNGDDDLELAFTGQLLALFGVTYFFF